jgi:predicted PurR-regulated permease PerM
LVFGDRLYLRLEVETMVMPVSASSAPANRISGNLERVLGAGLFILAIVYGKPILQPLALATLLCFVLAPLVRRLERFKIPRVASVLLVAAGTFTAMGTAGWLVTDQFIELSANFSTYKGTLIHRIRSVRGAAAQSLGSMSETLGDLNRELLNQPESDQGNPTAETTAESAKKPSKATAISLWGLLTRGENSSEANASANEKPSVQVVTVPQTPMQQLQDWLGPLLGPIAAGGLVIVLLIFMLLQHEDLRNRLIRLVGTKHLLTTTEALDETSTRLGKYLRMQLLVNTSFGIAVAIGLSLVGLPGALLWGALAMLFRFLPYIGPWLAGAFPFMLSLSFFDGWWGPGLVLAVFLVLELISNNVIEPWLYGTSVGISSFGVILSALFWTWLWGPLGLFFAMPFTVCLVVLGKHLPALAFINILLGESESLSTSERLYQRLLAWDRDEADRLIAEQASANGNSVLADEMLLPVLSLVERDWHFGSLDKGTRQGLLQSLEEIANIDEQDQSKTLVDAREVEQGASAMRKVLCVPTHDEADELAAEFCIKHLSRAGIDVAKISTASLAAEVVAKIDELKPDVVLISTVPPQELHHARYLCKKIRQRFPRVPMIVGHWQIKAATSEMQRQFVDAGATKVVCRFEGLEQVVQAISLAGVWLAAEPPQEQPNRPLTKQLNSREVAKAS